MKHSFIVISDTHFAAPGTGEDKAWWNRMLQSRSPEIADALVSTINRLAPDFVVHCGDITDAGDTDSFIFAKTVMDRFSCPCFTTLGNHDTWWKGNREKIAHVFGFAEKNFCYSRELAGFRFLFMDNAYWVKKDGTDAEYLDWDLYEKGGYYGDGPSLEGLRWLEKELEHSQHIPTIVVMHAPITGKPYYPVGSLPGGKPVKESLTPGEELDNYCVHREKLRYLIGRALNIIVVLAGHSHFFDIAFEEGTFHCQTGSLIEFPFEMRLVQFDHKRINMSTIGLDDERFAEASVVEEWGNRWVAGTAEDRELVIELP